MKLTSLLVTCLKNMKEDPFPRHPLIGEGNFVTEQTWRGLGGADNTAIMQRRRDRNLVNFSLQLKTDQVPYGGWVMRG